MIPLEILQKAMEAVAIMKTATTNLRLYPPTNAMISQTIDRLFQVLAEILCDVNPLILAESEKMLIVAGEAPGSKYQEKPQIQAFTRLLANLDIRSVSFENGLEKEELTLFLQALSRRPEEIKAEGGLQELIYRQGLLHIRIDEKIYVAKDKDQQIVAGLDIRDDDIVSFLMEADPESADLQQIKEKVKDPEWISGIFQNGMKHLKEQQGAVPNIQLSDNLVQMVRMLEKIADPSDQERIVHLVMRSVTEMDSEMISLFLSNEVQELFGGRLLEDIVHDLDEKRFAEIADGLTGMSAVPGERGRMAAVSLAAMMKTDKGRKLESERRIQAARENEERQKRLDLLGERLQGIMNGEESAFLDLDLMAELPDLHREICLLGDVRTADLLIERLTEKLNSRNPDIHNRAAETLSRLLDNLLADGAGDRAEHLAGRLAGWLRSETAISAAYETICLQLKELERTIFERNPFVEENHILDILSLIQSGRSPKEPNMMALAAEALRELATEELLEILFAELRTNEQGKQKQAARNLQRLGVAPVERLLRMLRGSEDSNERVQILQIISEIGAPSVPAIAAGMIGDESWFFLRNLVYILGRVGNETNAIDLAPLLLHENEKVKMEALKSLQRIGGKVRAETLLSVLSKADDTFKMSIVEMLGTIKAIGAVPALVNLLRSKPITAAPLKEELDVKICVALGSIGSEDALPALGEIANSKGFFIVRSSREKVRLAADKAIAAITQRKK
jgi:HEAT repeat protein